jgi:hypothetical protein
MRPWEVLYVEIWMLSHFPGCPVTRGWPVQKEILLGHYFKLHSSQHEDTPHLYQAYSTQSSASRQLCC